MNKQYARLENGNLVYAPKILTTPRGIVMNPGRMTYLANGWKFLDLQPPADPPEGKEYALSGYNVTCARAAGVGLPEREARTPKGPQGVARPTYKPSTSSSTL